MTDSRFERVCETVQQEMDRLPIPGVAVGVLYNGEEHIAGFGVTSVENPLPITPETLYQIGSISKTYLGTLVMRLVELGKLDLHAPLRRYLPDLKMQDVGVAENVTIFHCLTHTGGWLGDYFDDLGRGDDALARMVDAMQQLPQFSPLGEMWSYNNSGFYLVGRAIEVVTGESFEAAMHEYIFDPLELHSSYYFAEDVISRRFVVGHISEDDKPFVARPWALARTANPAGGIICNVPDLFRYARFHLGGGVTSNGTRLLSEESIAQMQTPRFSSTDPQSVCLTWYMTEVDGTRMFGHGGGTNGQITQFQIIPARNMAFAILTNSHRGSTLISTVTGKILQEYLNVPPAHNTPIEKTAAQLEPFLGRYEAALDDVEVLFKDGELILQTTNKGGFPIPTSPPATQPPSVRAAFYGDDKIFILDDPFKDTNCQFLRNAEGEIEWLRVFGRVHKRRTGD